MSDYRLCFEKYIISYYGVQSFFSLTLFTLLIALHLKNEPSLDSLERCLIPTPKLRKEPEVE